MSSLLGHAAAGFTAYLCCTGARRPPSRWAAAPLVGLAIAPDLDYFAVWLVDYAANPRVSHSLLFAVAMVLIVHRTMPDAGTVRFRLVGLLAAGGSHAVLDFLVGAHPVPVFWPFDAGVTCPVGVLPSAGALAPGNVYLWRNLLIELGLLAPVFALLVALCRRHPVRLLLAWMLVVAPMWTMFVLWSLALPRQDANVDGPGSRRAPASREADAA
jgi:inner membrane protein